MTRLVNAMRDDISDRMMKHTFTPRVVALCEEQARRKLTTALNSYFTTEKLVDAWPEIAPFVVTLAPVESVNLPALPTSDLNALFGLPV